MAGRLEVRAPRLGAARWLLLGLVAALAFAATMAIVEWRRAADLNSATTARDRAAAAAAAVGSALFSYDYRDLAATQQRILALASGGFAQQEASHASAISGNLVRLRAIGTASVQEVSVTGAAGGHASAVVVVDSQARSNQGSSHAVEYLRMSLVLQAGQWKVEAVQSLAPAAG